jgi:hypothetical protein
MSTLRRMFMYASAEGNRPLENFATEALVLAIKSDPAPIIDVLDRHQLLGTGRVGNVRPESQVTIRHDGQKGFLDLVLHVETTEGPLDIWFENKAHAPESGHQMDLYRSVIVASEQDGVGRHLVVLAPTPLGTRHGYTFVRWQEVADAARSLPEPGVWADLAAFLKEFRMVADATLPITLDEASSLDNAHHLFRKMDFVLRQVNRLAQDLVSDWPEGCWVRERDIGRALTADFVQRGRLRLRARSPHLAARIVWGAEPHADGAHLVVLIEVSLKRPAVRSYVLRSLEGRLPADWQRPEGRARLVAKERPAVAFGSDDAAIEWFMSCFRELRDAGFFGLIPSLGEGPIIEEPGARPEDEVLAGEVFTEDGDGPPA